MDNNSIHPAGRLEMLLHEHSQQQNAGGGGGSAASTPSFLRNTHDMISFCDRNNSKVASWGKNGTHMIIYDKEALTRDVFPGYFKHCNFKSFARQLNFYGFRKIKSKNKSWCIYHHDFFVSNRTDLLPKIQRQSNDVSLDEIPLMNTVPKVASHISDTNEVTELKAKVNALTSTVTSLQQEISDLRLLVASLADVIQTHDVLIRCQQNVPQISNIANIGMIANNHLHDPRNYDLNEPHHEASKPQAKQPPSPSFTLKAKQPPSPSFPSQAKQAPASTFQATFQPDSKHPPINYGATNTRESSQSLEPQYNYTMSVDHGGDAGSNPAKRLRTGNEEPYHYAPTGVARHPFSPAASTMNGTQQNNSQQSYDGHVEPWTIHASDHVNEVHHNVNNTSNHNQNQNSNLQLTQHAILTVNNYTQDNNGNNHDKNTDNDSNNNNTHQMSGLASINHDMECSADYDFGYEDVAWFALFEEDVSHQPDDPTTAPQA